MNRNELKEARLALGLTQAEFGEILGTSGNTVARWENGKMKVNEGWVRLGLAEARRRQEQLSEERGRRGPRRRGSPAPETPSTTT